jgi:predicted transcriptional regulator
VNGAIVLDDADGLIERASVTVWIGESPEPVTVSDAELELIDEGLQAAARGELLDARTFLAELRREG